MEVKGVTYFAGALSMANVPYHEEVLDFAGRVAAELAPDYELAAEHMHSCCVLLAHRRFRSAETGAWRTWIDQERFLSLVSQGGAAEALEYSTETPAWAVFGSAERGVAPGEKRVPNHNSSAADDQ